MKEKPKFMLILTIVIIAVSLFIAILFFSNNSSNYPYFCDNKSIDCDLSDADYHNPALSTEERVRDLLSYMTLEEKIGQLALVERKSLNKINDISNYNLGALLSGAGSHPDNNTTSGWREMVLAYQSYSQKTRLKIPILYGVDAIHGHGHLPGATVFPHQLGLAATRNYDLVKKINQATAQEMAATGIYWNFAPSLDIPQDWRWGRVYETYGSREDLVSSLGQAAIEGLQQSSSSPYVLATAKHYLGGGAMEWGSSSNKLFKIDQGQTNISKEELREKHLKPFQAAIEVGAMSIMAGLNSYKGEEMAINKHLLTDVLKDELGFTGFVLSDWYGIYQVSGNQYQNTIKAINAGVDMVMLPFNYQKFSIDMKQAVTSGQISTERLNDAVSRILRVKFALGLFDKPNAFTEDLSVVGSIEHRELARQAVRESLVVLKDNNKILPLSKKQTSVLVAGSAADNIGQQCGAWTVEWQGIEGNWLEGATSILSGIKQTINKDTPISYDPLANFSSETMADLGIAVVGEKPYAEGHGDSDNLKISKNDLETIARLRAKSKKLVVIIISGRPLDIKTESKDWDAVVAAWLPGSEGQGISDVLFGDYPFTGELPLEWKIN